MSWYYVDKAGNTQGPLQLNGMQQCFLSGKLVPQSFVWNGADVNQWTPLSKVGKLLKSCQDFKKSKQQQNKPSPTKSPPVRKKKSPFGGGGRAGLLGAIQRGTKLRKAPKPVEKKVGQPAPKKPGQKLSLREQMALTLRRRRNKSIGGNKVSTGQPKPKPKPKPVPKNNTSTTSSWKNKNNNTSTTSSWKSRNQNKTNNTSSYSSNKSTGGNSRIDNITKKLKNAQEWQLKAIEKLLS